MLLNDISVAELLQKDAKALATASQQRQREEAIERGKRARTIVGGDERPQVYRAGSLQPVGGDVAGVLSHGVGEDDSDDNHASSDVSPDAQRLTFALHAETPSSGAGSGVGDDPAGVGDSGGLADAVGGASPPCPGEGAGGVGARKRLGAGAAHTSACSASNGGDDDDDDDDDDLPISQWSARPATVAAATATAKATAAPAQAMALAPATAAPAMAPAARAAPSGGEGTSRAAREGFSASAAAAKGSHRDDLRPKVKRCREGAEASGRGSMEAEKAAICAMALEAQRAVEGGRHRPSERPPALSKQGSLGGFEHVTGLGGPISRQPSAASLPAVSRQSSLAASVPSISRQPSSLPPDRPHSRQVGFACAPWPVNLGHGAAAFPGGTSHTSTSTGAGGSAGGSSVPAVEALQAELVEAREREAAARQREKAVRAKAKAAEAAAAEREKAFLERAVLAEERANNAEEALATMRSELAEAAQAAVLDDLESTEHAMYGTGMATEDYKGTRTHDDEPGHEERDADCGILEIAGCAGGRLTL